MLKRDNSIDVAKGIGIILMIIGHSGCPVEFRGVIYTFHMPLFFLLAGYLYNKDKWTTRGFKELCVTKAKSYLIPYFALSGINLVLNAIYELEKYSFPLEWMRSQIAHTCWIFYGASESAKTPNSSPLWFLPCIFVAYIYFFQLMTIKRKNIQLLCCCIMSIALVVISKYTSQFINVNYLPWHIETALIGAVLMYIGYILKEKKVVEKVKGLKTYILLVIGAIGTIYINHGKVDMSATQIGEIFSFYVSSILMFVLISIFSKRISRGAIGYVLEFLGRQGMIAMGFNYWLNKSTKKIWSEIPFLEEIEYTWWMKTIVVLICISIISAIWEKFAKR